MVGTGNPEQILPTRSAAFLKPNKYTVSGVKITTQLTLRPCNTITVACGGQSNNAVKVN